MGIPIKVSSVIPLIFSQRFYRGVFWIVFEEKYVKPLILDLKAFCKSLLKVEFHSPTCQPAQILIVARASSGKTRKSAIKQVFRVDGKNI
jgi:hypothetical protein